MKTLFLRLMYSVLVVALFSANSQAQSEAEYKAKIEKMNLAMKEAMLSGNADANLAFYAKDAISLPSYEPMIEGVDALRKSNEAMKKSGMKVVKFEPTTYKVNVSGNLVTEVGFYEIGFTYPGMDKPIEDKGKYLTVYEIQPDKSLKIKIETWNTDKNPMEEK
jgi:ketosteroid isomerase-like protein